MRIRCRTPSSAAGIYEYYVCYVTAAEVRNVAEALHRVDEAWLRRRYDALGTDYDGPHNDEDFEYTWENFVDMRAFYDRAAKPVALSSLPPPEVTVRRPTPRPRCSAGCGQNR